MKSVSWIRGCLVCLLMVASGSGAALSGAHYKVLAPVTQNNLTVFPVAADAVFDTSGFITLDEGIRSGQVVITERPAGHAPITEDRGLVRPRVYPPSIDDGIWSERPARPPEDGPRVNELSLVNRSDKPLLLLAGEIVMGGKQDRIISRDRIVPAHSSPVGLEVFCVEPRRWQQTSTRFGALNFSMAQPGVRMKAMAEQDQQAVWNEVAKSRASFAAGLGGAQSRAIQVTSSYAGAMQSEGLKQQLDSMAVPLDRMFDKLREQLRAEKAVGAVVALNGQLIWADVFASPALLDQYWPKLLRSYAAEAFSSRAAPRVKMLPPTREDAQDFLDRLDATRESVNTEPGLYRTTELTGYDFRAFILTSLLPKTGFTVHLAKMRRSASGI